MLAQQIFILALAITVAIRPPRARRPLVSRRQGEGRKMKISGSATTEGTERYRKRFDGKIPADHFRQSQELWMSSIGIGTYLGNYDDATDQEYHQAAVRAVESGCNVIDSAINYRLQRSELPSTRAQGAGDQKLQPRRDHHRHQRRIYSL
jgi:hypothetical protein